MCKTSEKRQHLCNQKMKAFFRNHFLSLAFLFIIPHAAFTGTVTFPVNGLEVKAPEAIPISVEWNENWFYETKTNEYHHGIARIAALLSEISYVQVEKHPDTNEMINSYRALGVKDSDIEWNYTLDYTTPIMGNNQAAYSFAYKTTQTPEGIKKIVFVVLRGTPLSANEWLSNINVSDSTHKNLPVHEGFFNTVSGIHKSLIYFLLKNKISPEEAYFLITGHSRGAALANLLGASLENEGIITGERLFVYTFAAPNVTQEDSASDPRYNFIWNIINAEDIVPSVPPNRNRWKWKKYGQTKVLVNYWNTEPEKYLKTYLPRMNEYYSKFLLRDYAPFKNGPFLQIQVARILTSVYKNVESYYGRFFGLRSLAEKIFWKIFPTNSDSSENTSIISGGQSDKTSPASHEQNPDKSKETEIQLPLFLRLIQKNVNENTDGGFEYVMHSFIDMHACETYLAWLLALDETESYSTLGSVEITIDQSYDCAVYDDDGNLLARVIDGSYQLYSLKIPFAGIPLPNKNVFGFPGNRNLNIVIYKDSLAPTILTYRLEHYDASGKLLELSEKQHFYPRIGRALAFKAGECTLNTKALNYTKLSKEETKQLNDTYNLDQTLKFKFQPEFSFSTDKIINLGFRTGSQSIFFTMLTDLFVSDSTHAFGLTAGLGHQQSLYGRIYLDIELLNHIIWTPEDQGEHFVDYVPGGRISISYKPRQRLQFFIAGLFDAHIEGLNDHAFLPIARKKNLSTITISDSLEFVPSLQFGIRF